MIRPGMSFHGALHEKETKRANRCRADNASAKAAKVLWSRNPRSEWIGVSIAMPSEAANRLACSSSSRKEGRDHLGAADRAGFSGD